MTTSRSSSTVPVVPSPMHFDHRQESVDSAVYYEQDTCDEYDDFALGGKGGSTGNSVMNKSTTKHNKRQENRGSGGGSGTIYSAKHVRISQAKKTTMSSSNTSKKNMR